MEKLRVAEKEREQLARHNTLLERAIIARDKVAADFTEASAAGAEKLKVRHDCPSSHSLWAPCLALAQTGGSFLQWPHLQPVQSRLSGPE